MSSSALILVPDDPRHVPAENLWRPARDAFARLAPNAGAVEAVRYDRTEFVSPGENLVRIACPCCDFDLADANSAFGNWWGEQMDRAFESSAFEQLEIRTPCCSVATNLNDLRYHWPAGFAVWALKADDAGILPPAPHVVREFEALLQCRLRLVVAHY